MEEKMYRFTEADEGRCISCERCFAEGDTPHNKRYYCSMRPNKKNRRGYTMVVARMNFCRLYVGVKRARTDIPRRMSAEG